MRRERLYSLLMRAKAAVTSGEFLTFGQLRSQVLTTLRSAPEEHLPLLVAQVDSTSTDVYREAILGIIAQTGHPIAARALLRVLSDSNQSARLRAIAIDALPVQRKHLDGAETNQIRSTLLELAHAERLPDTLRNSAVYQLASPGTRLLDVTDAKALIEAMLGRARVDNGMVLVALECACRWPAEPVFLSFSHSIVLDAMTGEIEDDERLRSAVRYMVGSEAGRKMLQKMLTESTGGVSRVSLAIIEYMPPDEEESRDFLLRVAQEQHQSNPRLAIASIQSLSRFADLRGRLANQMYELAAREASPGSVRLAAVAAFLQMNQRSRSAELRIKALLSLDQDERFRTEAARLLDAPRTEATGWPGLVRSARK